LIDSLERLVINKDKDLQLEQDINQKWQAAQALKAPTDRRELRSRFVGQVLDGAVLKELYEEQERVEAKKQEKRKSQVGGKRRQKGKNVVQFDDIGEEDLGVEEIDAEEWLQLDSWSSEISQISSSSPRSTIILATPRPPEPSTPGPKPTKTSLRYPVSSPASPTIGVTRSRRSHR